MKAKRKLTEEDVPKIVAGMLYMSIKEETNKIIERTLDSEYIKKSEVLQKIKELQIHSLRLNIFGAEFDNKIKGKVFRSEEPTTKVYMYLDELKEFLECEKE